MPPRPQRLSKPLLLGAFGFKMSHDVDSSLNVSINQTSRTITLWDNLHPIISSSVVHEPVPSDYNIFALLRVAPPKGHEDNDDFLRNWTVVFGQDSPWRDELNRTYEFIKESQLNSTLSSEDQNILWGLYIPVMIIGSTLNLCLLWALLSDRQLRCDPRNSFILALSFSDFLLCNFTCPVTFWSMVAGKWPFGKHTEILCKFFKAAQDFPIVMSSFCIGAIACDRHRVIIQTSSTQMNAIQGVFFSLLLAFTGAVILSPIFVQTHLHPSEILLDTVHCEVEWPKEYRHYYPIITSAVHYFLTLIIVLVLYTRIYIRLRSRPPSQHEEVNKKRRRTNILLASITIVFFVCWAPMVIFSFVYEMGNIYEPNDVAAQFCYAITMLFGMLTPILNPILYSMCNENVRKKLDEKCPGFLSFGSSKEAKKQNSSAEEYPLKENNELNGNPSSQQPLKKENTFVVESNTTGQVVTSIGEGSSLMQPSSYHV